MTWIDILTLIALVMTSIAGVFFLTVAAAIFDNATGKRWGLLAISLLLCGMAILFIRTMRL